MLIMKEKTQNKTVVLYESLIIDIQKFADKHYNGDFSQALRKISRIGLEHIKSGSLQQKNYGKELL